MVQDLIQVRNALELYRSVVGRYPDDVTALESNTTQARGINCWDCTLSQTNGKDSNKLNVLSPYLNPRPISGVVTGASLPYGYWYKVNPTGTDFKVAIFNMISGNGTNPYAYVPANMIDNEFGRPPSGVTPPAISVYSSDRAKDWRRICVFDDDPLVVSGAVLPSGANPRCSCPASTPSCV